MPTGIVAKMMSQANRSSAVVARRVRNVTRNARMIRTQSRR